MVLIDDVYLGENNEGWFIWMWFDESFGDDDFLAYTLKWWIVFVELIGLNENNVSNTSFIDVNKWWAYVNDLIRDWMCLLR